MAKRQKLDYDEQQLTERLKASSGRGVHAFFSSDESPINKENDMQIDAPKDLSPKLPVPEANEDQPGDQPYARTGVRTAKRTDGRPADQPDVHSTARSVPEPFDELRTGFWSLPSIPKKRKPERYAFQLWSDQITRLKKLHKLLNLRIDPEEHSAITLSDMAREAFDAYLEQETGKLKESHTLEPNERTGVRTAGRSNDRTDRQTDDRLNEPAVS